MSGVEWDNGVPCPACGAKNLLVTMRVFGCLVINRYGFISAVAPTYGQPEHGTVALGDAVECNRNTCGWKGTVQRGPDTTTILVADA